MVQFVSKLGVKTTKKGPASCRSMALVSPRTQIITRLMRVSINPSHYFPMSHEKERELLSILTKLSRGFLCPSRSMNAMQFVVPRKALKLPFEGARNGSKKSPADHDLCNAKWWKGRTQFGINGPCPVCFAFHCFP